MTFFNIANLGDAALNIPESTVTGTGTLATGGFIWVNNTSSAPITLTLSSDLVPFVIIKDIAGNAGTYTITITYSGGIDGGTSITLTEPYQSVLLGWNGSSYSNGSINLGVVNSNVGTFQGITVNSQGLVTAAAAQNVTLSGDVSGTGALGSSVAATLATVNSDVGTFQGLTVNGKGLVTAAVAQTRATLQTSYSNPSSTTSTTEVMAGLNATITPEVTGNVFFTITGSMGSNAACYVTARSGTGTPPSNGAAATGTQHGGLLLATVNSTVGTVPFSVSGMIIGATLGTALWLDVAFETSNASDAALLSAVAVCAAEI